MPNFEEKESTVNISKTYDVSTTCDESAKSTESEGIKEENPLDKVTTDETKDESKRQEKHSLQRDVSVDALSSKLTKMLALHEYNLFIYFLDNLKSLSSIKSELWNAPIPIFNNGNLCL